MRQPLDKGCCFSDLLLNPTSPTNPEAKISMVAGSGTGERQSSYLPFRYLYQIGFGLNAVTSFNISVWVIVQGFPNDIIRTESI